MIFKKRNGFNNTEIGVLSTGVLEFWRVGIKLKTNHESAKKKHKNKKKFVIF